VHLGSVSVCWWKGSCGGALVSLRSSALGLPSDGGGGSAPDCAGTASFCEGGGAEGLQPRGLSVVIKPLVRWGFGNNLLQTGHDHERATGVAAGGGPCSLHYP
jgi:hypothetical protein